MADLHYQYIVSSCAISYHIIIQVHINHQSFWKHMQHTCWVFTTFELWTAHETDNGDSNIEEWSGSSYHAP